jgi:hypothetical protein
MKPYRRYGDLNTVLNNALHRYVELKAHNPFIMIKIPEKTGILVGGEGGIRTREPLRVTRAPGVRAKPDYATSPIAAGFPTAGGIIPLFWSRIGLKMRPFSWQRID